MNLTLPTNFANAVAPFAPLGRQPVGEESPDSKDSRFKSVEESAELARGENRRGPDDRPNEVEERERLRIEADEERRRQSAEGDAGEEPSQQDEERLAQESRDADLRHQAGNEADVFTQRANDLNRRLIEIGVVEPPAAAGRFFDQNV